MKTLIDCTRAGSDLKKKKTGFTSALDYVRNLFKWKQSEKGKVCKKDDKQEWKGKNVSTRAKMMVSLMAQFVSQPRIKWTLVITSSIILGILIVALCLHMF